MNTKLNHNTTAEYVIIGGGPAAICAIPNILKLGVDRNKIIWIDPQFKVGDFGSVLSHGSSVPGNTMAKCYQRVNQEIYKILPTLKPENDQLFELNHLPPNFVGSLKVAAAPLQNITQGLRKIIKSIKGTVCQINSCANGLTLEIRKSNNQLITLKTKRAILAIGAKPKTLSLPDKHHHISMISPNTAFIQSEIKKYIKQQSNINTVAVIGSSHSAALATMHLLKAGVTVKQFMNKEYKYATPAVTADGIEYTQYDNTGLKGDVAKFTKQLIDDINLHNGPYANKLMRFISEDREELSKLLLENLDDCNHVVATIGYNPSQTLLINNHPISDFKHNNKTTQFEGINGLFGIGIAFPQVVKSISGEEEPAVGVEKFWNTTSNQSVLDTWQNCIL